jgi:hypothetical protein
LCRCGISLQCRSKSQLTRATGATAPSVNDSALIAMTHLGPSTRWQWHHAGDRSGRVLAGSSAAHACLRIAPWRPPTESLKCGGWGPRGSPGCRCAGRGWSGSWTPPADLILSLTQPWPGLCDLAHREAGAVSFSARSPAMANTRIAGPEILQTIRTRTSVKARCGRPEQH